MISTPSSLPVERAPSCAEKTIMNESGTHVDAPVVQSGRKGGIPRCPSGHALAVAQAGEASVQHNPRREGATPSPFHHVDAGVVQSGRIITGDTTIAYLAGILDGEGSIMIRKTDYRVRNPKYGDCVNPSYTPRVGIKNTNEDVIKLFKDVFHGHYHRDRVVYYSQNGFRPTKIIYSYGAEHRLAVIICKTLLPYLIIKRRQAEKALELDALKYSTFRSKAWLPADIEKFEKIYWEVKSLNV